MALRPARVRAVWSVGPVAYVAAVPHHTSLGVAGPGAQARFGVGVGVLASFAVSQLLVYAGPRVPVRPIREVLAERLREVLAERRGSDHLSKVNQRRP